MAVRITGGTPIARALEQVGYPLPKNCVDASVELRLDDAFVIHFRCYIEPEDLGKIGAALQIVAEQEK